MHHQTMLLCASFLISGAFSADALRDYRAKATENAPVFECEGPLGLSLNRALVLHEQAAEAERQSVKQEQLANDQHQRILQELLVEVEVDAMLQRRAAEDKRIDNRHRFITGVWVFAQQQNFARMERQRLAEEERQRVEQKGVAEAEEQNFQSYVQRRAAEHETIARHQGYVNNAMECGRQQNQVRMEHQRLAEEERRHLQGDDQHVSEEDDKQDQTAPQQQEVAEQQSTCYIC